MELTIDEALKTAVENYEGGKLQEADRLYTAILKVQPKHPDANHNMGVLAVSVGKVAEALPFFETALETNPITNEFWLSYIDALMRLNRFLDARNVYQQAKETGLDDIFAERLHERIFGNYYKNDSEDDDILSEASFLKEDGRYRDAIKLIESKLDNFSRIPQVLGLLAHCYILEDETNTAINLHTKAKEIAPEIAIVGWNEARLLLKQNNFSKALKITENCRKNYPDDPDGLILLAVCLRLTGDLETSMNVLNNMIEKNVDIAEVYINRSLIHLLMENKTAALSDLQIAHRLKPRIKQIWDLLISLIVEISDRRLAISTLINMIELDPLNSKSFSQLGALASTLDDKALAVKAFSKIVEVRPQDPENHFNYALAQFNAGELELAVRSYKNALKINPNYAAAYNNLGNALRDMGKDNEAMNAYESALEIQPDFGAAHENLGILLEAKGKLHEAVHAYDNSPTQAARARSLEALYALGNQEELRKRISNLNLEDPHNIRAAALCGYMAHEMNESNLYNFCNDPLSMIRISNLKNYMADHKNFIKSLLAEMNATCADWEPNGKTTKGGFQTSNKLFDQSSAKLKSLERIIKEELRAYKQQFSLVQDEIIYNFPETLKISAWFVRLLQGGHQSSHIHPGGWVSGVIYLKPVNSPCENEGAIRFGLHGYNYQRNIADYPSTTYQPNEGDIILFPSSLFHETIPVEQEIERCVIAFDLKPR